MPFLDVTPLLTDPDFADTFTVRRRAEVVDMHGRVTVAETDFGGVVGVVTAIGPSDLDRRDDYEAMSRSISVVTKFPVRGETKGYQPDIIVWRGDNFVVKHIQLYPHFGPGFFEVECSSMDKTDNAIGSGLTPQLAFNQATNTAFVATIG